MSRPRPSRVLVRALCAAAAIFAAAPTTSAGDAVEVLTDANFDDTVLADSGLWLVKFYAPWCGHCKHLAPVYEEAAQKLRGQGLMRLGKIDATVETGLAARYGVKGYPTLQYVRDGELHRYTGERTAEGFVAFAERMNRPPVHPLTTKPKLGKFTAQAPVTFVLGAPAGGCAHDGDAVRDAFFGVAYRLHASEYLGCADQDDVVESVLARRTHSGRPFIARVEKGEVPQFFPLDAAAPREDALVAWIEASHFPTVIALGQSNFYSSANAGKMLVTLVLDSAAKNQPVLDQLRRIARLGTADVPEDVRNKFLYGWIDGVEHSKFVEQYGVTKDSLPRVIVFDAPQKLHYKDVDVLTKGALPRYLQSIARGDVAPVPEGLAGYMQLAIAAVHRYAPWSYALGAVSALALLLLIVSCLRSLCADDDDVDDERAKQD